MTLIAIATYGSDRAEFITDTTWYTHRVSHLGRCTKSLALPHLDAAVITQGDSDFGVLVKIGALTASADAATFDELVEHAPMWLRQLWADAPTKDGDVATVFMVGWSDRDQKFRAWCFATEHDFAPSKIPGLFVTPTPWTMRPSKLELERVRAIEADDPRIDEVTRLWMAKPATPAPRTTQEWVDLALAAQAQRGVTRGSYNHVIVAGEVIHTKLKRGSVETRKIHTFDDADLFWVVEFTEHPIALAGPCYCDSGKTYGDCHAGESPCGCRSGMPFGECHGASRAGDPTRAG